MFVGRTKELGQLRQLIQNNKSSIGVIYGRRRIGKSELIKKAFNQHSKLIFEGLENRPKQEQINSFVFQLRYQLGKEHGDISIKSWKEAFILLYEELKQKPVHVILDEFQWMANYRNEIVSELKLVWDLYISKIEGITLILCGSIASFMIKKVIKSSALYGRADLIIHLKGFLLPETREILADKGTQEIIDAYMFLGGVPKYLDLIREKPSVRLAIEELAFTETGYLTDEFQRIFISHFGKKRGYRKIIHSLAKHPYGLFRKQISEESGVDLGGGLTGYLTDLESAGFISSSTPFNKNKNSKLLKYRLSDPYMRFYFSFIEPNLKRIKSGSTSSYFAQLTQKGAFNAWIGIAFENLCIEHAIKISEILGFSGIDYSFGPYFCAPGKDSGVQIDLLFDRNDKVITLCEMKYTLAPVGIGIIQDVERKVNLLRNKFKQKTIQKVLISLSPPTKDLIAMGYFFKVIHPESFLN